MIQLTSDEQCKARRESVTHLVDDIIQFLGLSTVNTNECVAEEGEDTLRFKNAFAFSIEPRKIKPVSCLTGYDQGHGRIGMRQFAAARRSVQQRYSLHRSPQASKAHTCTE